MKRKIPLILLCAVFLGIAGYFGFRLFAQWNEYRIGQKAYDELTQYVHIDDLPAAEALLPDKIPDDASPEETVPQVTEPQTEWPVVDFTALQQINPDIVAWIYIEGTDINYPVVQGPDNSYYLNRLFDGSFNGAGSIFMDYRNQGDLTDRHTVFYGHHMNNGSMFAQITKYKDQAFYDAHPTCLIMTPGGNYKLEFFAGYVTDMNAQAWKLQFASDEEYEQWLSDAVARSNFVSTAEPSPQDRVVTFSTCTYEYNDARYVLAGILK